MLAGADCAGAYRASANWTARRPIRLGRHLSLRHARQSDQLLIGRRACKRRQNRLMSDSAVSASYSCDSNGRRAAKRVLGAPTNFPHDGDSKIAEYGAGRDLVRSARH